MTASQNAYDIAEKLLVDLPVGSVVKIPAAFNGSNWFFQHQESGIVSITPGAYARALNGE